MRPDASFAREDWGPANPTQESHQTPAESHLPATSFATQRTSWCLQHISSHSKPQSHRVRSYASQHKRLAMRSRFILPPLALIRAIHYPKRIILSSYKDAHTNSQS